MKRRHINAYIYIWIYIYVCVYQLNCQNGNEIVSNFLTWYDFPI